MDIPKIIEFLGSYPNWFRYLLVLWILATAMLVGGLVILRPNPTKPADDSLAVDPGNVAPSIESIIKQSNVTEPKPNQNPIKPSAEPAVTSTHQAKTEEFECRSDITFQQYADMHAASSDRFYQRHELISSCEHKIVEWIAYIHSVSEKSNVVSVVLTLEADSSGMSLLATLPAEFMTKAFSLRKNDLVRIRGRLDLSTPSFPVIEATGLISRSNI